MSNADFPRMIYRAGGTEEIHGGYLATLIVQDADELDAALAGGWFMTTPEAKQATEPKADDAIPDDDAAPTRDELKRKATDLGLVFASNIPTDKLAGLVEAALKA